MRDQTKLKAFDLAHELVLKAGNSGAHRSGLSHLGYCQSPHRIGHAPTAPNFLKPKA
jgi:hypothetical protein